MSVEFKLEIPQADIRALHAAMERARKELGNGLGGSVRMAGFQLSRTLGTSTHISAKKRPYEIIAVRRPRGSRPRKNIVDIKSERVGQFTQIIPGGKREINKSAAVTVGMSGIAKASWRWAARKARSPMSSIAKTGMTRSAEQWANKYAGGDSVTKGDDPYYRIQSRINYITQAMDQGAANDAMRRAASGMNQWIDGELKRRFNAK